MVPRSILSINTASRCWLPASRSRQFAVVSNPMSAHIYHKVQYDYQSTTPTVHNNGGQGTVESSTMTYVENASLSASSPEAQKHETFQPIVSSDSPVSGDEHQKV
ncbi:unnamed protein product [Kuraishia capsulata CBS 1993]|uniref:Uncharacterized protein n=1 Tax=Kuraishia capsulata CBS 1993 TaxID=1382522 RepID=W6MLD1_9ASCO|nr:uncharacterized protein KUCA_T00002895001 [Kuraishia capsulata CBS 1993]CDK26918.1 unnamed protein product [Kuraishia capsulata CBS 1993]